MKALCFYFLVLFLIIAPCNGQPNAQQEKIQPLVLTANTANAINDTIYNGSNCFSQKQIFPETAAIWQASWEAFHNYDLSNPGSESYQDSPKFKIPAATMNLLYEERPGSDGRDGVLISYVRQNGTNDPEYPMLAIQNISDCNFPNIDDNTIYLVPYPTEDQDPQTGDTILHAITAPDFTSWTTNYKNNMESKDEVFSIAEGYMYSWDSLLNETNDATATGIAIRYGLRTLGESEQTEFSENPDTSADGRVGSLVYCNILYFGTTIDEGILDGTNTMLYDFARPCPTFCNDYPRE